MTDAPGTLLVVDGIYILVPEHVTPEAIEAAIALLRARAEEQP